MPKTRAPRAEPAALGDVLATLTRQEELKRQRRESERAAEIERRAAEEAAERERQRDRHFVPIHVSGPDLPPEELRV